MGAKLAVTILLACFASPVLAAKELDGVLMMHEGHFRSKGAKFFDSRFQFLLFTADYGLCEHCEEWEKTWVELAATLNEEHTDVAAIDCSTHSPSCKRFRVKYFPTVVLLFNGKKSKEYEGPREIGELVNYVRRTAAAVFKTEL
ncbi:hypothetical protein CYMTET_8638 [Cymbomonas tetramitiformis]|uniref:Thioredoxin domain-containing protein n=1 Tax=Cymbomonas tetramitiformis TaxID=36881 RepID=A0AAE0GT36_9CHLO|nr:hypothetical protein CYMTET_8638 [Cymbomonas tetramitiformis]